MTESQVWAKRLGKVVLANNGDACLALLNCRALLTDRDSRAVERCKVLVAMLEKLTKGGTRDVVCDWAAL